MQPAHSYYHLLITLHCPHCFYRCILCIYESASLSAPEMIIVYFWLLLMSLVILNRPLDAVPLTFPGPGENTADVWSSYEDIRTGSRSAVRWNRWGSGDAAAAALVNTDSLLQRRWSGGRGAAIRGVKGSAKLQTLAESWLFRWERGESNAVMASLPQGGRRRKKETTLMHLRSSD